MMDLKMARQIKGLAQQNLAVRAHTSTAVIVAIERYGHIPGPDLRRRLSAALGIAETELWPESTKIELENK